MVMQSGQEMSDSEEANKKRGALLGAYTSLENCLSTADGQDAVDECLIEYDERVGANRAEPSAFSVGPIALLAVAFLVAAGSQGIIPV